MFAARLKNLRKEVGFTQVELAEKLGVSKGTVAMWETRRREPGVKNIKRLSEILNKRIDYLLCLSDDDSLLVKVDKAESFDLYTIRLPKTMEKLMEHHPVTGEKTTLRELARAIGISARIVSLYLLGSKQPEALCLLKMAGYFNVSTDYLLTEKDDFYKKIRRVNDHE